MGALPDWGAEVVGRLRERGIAEGEAAATVEIARNPEELWDLMLRMEELQPGSGGQLWSLLSQ